MEITVVRKLLFILCIASFTNVFAAIKWSCSSDMPPSYLPNDCVATVNSTSGSSILPRKLVNYSAMFRGVDLAGCIKRGTGSSGADGGAAAVKSCMTSAFLANNISLDGWDFIAHSDESGPINFSDGIVHDWYPAMFNFESKVFIELVGPNSAKQFNAFYPNSAVKLPETGSEAVMICDSFDRSYVDVCPIGSYAMTSSVSGDPPMLRFESYVIVK